MSHIYSLKGADNKNYVCYLGIWEIIPWFPQMKANKNLNRKL